MNNWRQKRTRVSSGFSFYVPFEITAEITVQRFGDIGWGGVSKTILPLCEFIEKTFILMRDQTRYTELPFKGNIAITQSHPVRNTRVTSFPARFFLLDYHNNNETLS